MLSVFFRKSWCYEMSKDMVEPETPQMTIWRHIVRWISKATCPQAYTIVHAPIHTHKSANTHTEYVILTDFPRQQWLRERASMLRYTYIVLLLRCLCS